MVKSRERLAMKKEPLGGVIRRREMYRCVGVTPKRRNCPEKKRCSSTSQYKYAHGVKEESAVNNRDANRAQFEYTTSFHAEKRQQQRGITHPELEIVLGFGRRRPRKNAYVCFMDKGSRRKAEASLGHRYHQFSDKLNLYVVVSREGHVITAGHRLNRMKW